MGNNLVWYQTRIEGHWRGVGDHARMILAGIEQEREDPNEITGKRAL
jgi:hypothetical protein